MSQSRNNERDLEIDLSTTLSIGACYRFPIQNSLARREVLLGAAWLLLPFVGWVLNMGHRIMMVHNMMHGRSAWPSWRNYAALLRHGTITLLGMLYYYLPALVVGWISVGRGSAPLGVIAALLGVFATIAIPGYMSHYCHSFDVREIFDPVRALGRCAQAGRHYWRAWAIALSALVLSFVGLLAVGVGFLVSSVWFWQVAGFAFATVMSREFALPGRTRCGSRNETEEHIT